MVATSSAASSLAKTVAPLLALGLVATADAVSAFGPATPMFYVVAVFACLWSERRPVPVAAAAIVLTALVGWLASHASTPIAPALEQRVAAMVLVLIAAIAVDRQLRMQRALEQGRTLVQERDLALASAAEERLRAQSALKQLGQLASVVAHEVRNPIAGISGALQIIVDRQPAGSEEREIIGDILRRLDELNATMAALLAYAQPRPAVRTPSDVHALLLDLAAKLASDPRFSQMEVSVLGGSVVASIDRLMLHEALMHLAINATQAMVGAGHLRLEAQQVGDHCVVRVVDDGAGLSAEARVRAFEPFFSSRNRGAGLGLPSVQRIVAMHQGEVRLMSPVEGGTLVELVLPMGLSRTSLLVRSGGIAAGRRSDD